MHRIDSDTATIDGLFTEGDPDIGQLPTTFTPEWCNDVQETIAQAIEGAGIELVKGTHDQLLDAIRQLISDSPHTTPLGGYQMSSRVIADDDYYQFPKGQALALPAYQDMLDALTGDPFLTTVGATKTANPSLWWYDADNSLLYMPDERGQFSRIWKNDLAAGGVTRPGLGIRKANQNKAHTHGIDTNQADTSGDGSVADSTGVETPHSANTQSSGGDEAVPDHTAHYYRIRVQ